MTVTGAQQVDDRRFYSAADYRVMCSGSRSTADVVVPLLEGLLSPRSVVDVGCGTGEWLAAWKRRGVTSVAGIDGPWLDPEVLVIDADEFHARDLEQRLDLDRGFDLALCLEVAGYMRRDRVEVFVDNLVGLAPAVLFSAPIPYQSDKVDRPTLEWPDYWAARFADRGFVCLDALRSRLWHDERVEPWIAQNALLFLHEDELRRRPGLTGQVTGCPHALVHPEIYLDAAARTPMDLVRRTVADLPGVRPLRQLLGNKRTSGTRAPG
jgi:SAM-dependent methyltransferase